MITEHLLILAFACLVLLLRATKIKKATMLAIALNLLLLLFQATKVAAMLAIALLQLLLRATKLAAMIALALLLLPFRVAIMLTHALLQVALRATKKRPMLSLTVALALTWGLMVMLELRRPREEETSLVDFHEQLATARSTLRFTNDHQMKLTITAIEEMEVEHMRAMEKIVSAGFILLVRELKSLKTEVTYQGIVQRVVIYTFLIAIMGFMGIGFFIWKKHKEWIDTLLHKKAEWVNILLQKIDRCICILLRKKDEYIDILLEKGDEWIHRAALEMKIWYNDALYRYSWGMLGEERRPVLHAVVRRPPAARGAWVPIEQSVENVKCLQFSDDCSTTESDSSDMD